MEPDVLGVARAASAAERDAATRRHQLMIFVDRVRGVLVIKPVGEIDIVTGGVFLESLIAAVAAGESRLVVDLQQVPFMDSTGLAIFLSVDRALRTIDGQLRLVAGPEVDSILSVGSVDEIFPIDTSVGVAVTHLADRVPRRG